MKIFGLNIASSSADENGRGWIDPKTQEFVYLPIPEDWELERPVPTYRELGFADVAYPHLPVHLDPKDLFKNNLALFTGKTWAKMRIYF